MSYPVYQEKQWIKGSLFALPVVLLILLVPEFRLVLGAQSTSGELGAHHGFWVAAVLWLILMLTFSQLTVSVDETCLRWNFGFFHFPAWKIPLTDISSVEASTSAWYEGKGLRMTRSGMLYNASGNLVLKIYKKDGKVVRLGTADPQRWLSYLQPRIAG